MARPRKVVEPPNHGKYYEIKATVGRQMDGSLIRKSFYSEISKEDARRKANEYITNQKVADLTGVGFIDNNITFGQFASKWLESVKGTVKDNTYDLTYANTVNNHLIPYFGHARVCDIRQLDVQQYMNQMGKIKSLSTLNKHKMCLKNIFESAVNNDIIRSSPVRKIKLSSSVVTAAKRVYKEDDVAKILAYADQHKNGLQIKILLRLGLRRGELLELKWSDIDFETNVLHIQRAVAEVKDSSTGKYKIIEDDPKNEVSIRDIPIPSDIAEELKKKQGHSKSEYIFPNQDGKVMAPKNWSNRTYKNFMQDMHDYYASLPEPVDIPILNPHELRHTCTSILVNNGKNLYAIASVLGWANLKMLRERYAHADAEALREQLGFE